MGVFSLVFGEEYQFGLCKSTDLKLNISKFLPNNQYMLDNNCMSCADGWFYSSERCFKIFEDFSNYDIAQSKCESYNGYLAILNNDAKFNFVKSLAKYIINVDGSFVINRSI